MNEEEGIKFLQWALPQRGYRWPGFRKPRSQVLKRIRDRMEELNLSGGYDEYRLYLEEHPEEWEVFDSFCYVTISKFFRDRKLWEFIRDEILREYLNDENQVQPVDIWSAGCCNGEEPYSITIIVAQLMEKMPDTEDVQILASDREEDVLKRAQEGVFPASALKELTKEELNSYFGKVDFNDNEQYSIRQELKKPVEFEKRNIRESLPDRKFDLVFCRNLVFTYLRQEQAENFLSRLKPILKQRGYLIIGSNEQIPSTDWLTQVVSGQPVYKKE